MAGYGRFKKWLTDIFYSFPVQLVILHFRNNHLLLFLWLFLALLMTGVLGKSFGITYLFLDPEYLGKVDVRSFFILGLAFGTFFMSWNLTTYLLSTHFFPFLAALRRPFIKFCLNNGLIPLAFLSLYIGFAIYFQIHYEYWTAGNAIINMLGFVIGMVSTIMLFAFYLQLSNKDITNFAKKGKEIPPDRVQGIAPGHRGVDVEIIKLDKNRWRVDTYLNEYFKPWMTRSVAHYDSRLLFNIFRQNHLNALALQLFTIVVLLILGSLMDYSFFRIPAGASIFILASVVTALIGAVFYWLHAWRVTVLILLLLGANYLTSLPWFNFQNQAYGLDYKTTPAIYSHERLMEGCNPSIVRQDIDSTLLILNNWHRKTGQEKPKMVVFCISGGGLKASVWTMQILQKVDSLLKGALFRHTVLMTGASGGMIGAAYFRELNLRKLQGTVSNPHDPIFLDDISKDLLNSISFAIVSNDLFLPFSTFRYSNQTYTKDRGYMFELQLNENTGHILDKSLITYRQPEQDALIPLIIISPAIINDARRLLISPQNISYLTSYFSEDFDRRSNEVDAVDFRQIFREQQADSLRFTTALRMNATYPWILPNVLLPSQPGIKVMDAGFRDNLGVLSATRFIQVFKDWILENTSGVVLIQISSVKEAFEIPASERQGTIESLLNPLGILSHIVRLQDFEHETNFGFLSDLLGKEQFEVIRLIYEPSPENERASMTFHLTQREKNDILKAFYLERNQQGIQRLQGIFGKDPKEKK